MLAAQRLFWSISLLSQSSFRKLDGKSAIIVLDGQLALNMFAQDEADRLKAAIAGAFMFARLLTRLKHLQYFKVIPRRLCKHRPKSSGSAILTSSTVLSKESRNRARLLRVSWQRSAQRH